MCIRDSNSGDSIDLLCKQLPPDQIVPRGHYFRSGTLRFGDVQFVAARGLAHLLDNQPVLNGKGADIHLRVILPASQSQFREADKILRERQRELAEGLFIAIAQPPTHSLAALSDLITWQWVQANIPALAGDRHAREEVARLSLIHIFPPQLPAYVRRQGRRSLGQRDVCSPSYSEVRRACQREWKVGNTVFI